LILLHLEAGNVYNAINFGLAAGQGGADKGP
jgi:hypothetical protein